MSLAIEQPVLLVSTDSSTSASISSPSPTPAFSIMAATSTARPFASSSTANLGVPTFIATSESPSPSIDNSHSMSPPFVSDAPNGEPDSPTATNTTSDIDPQILEALRSKDTSSRLYVLRLGELMEGLINDRRAHIDLTPATSYQRLLVHRCSAYYRLSPESDPVSKGIIVLLTPESRIPARRLCELVPAEPTAPRAFTIMSRDRRPKTQSQAGSVAGEDADFSDIEPSESGSLGGRSNATGGSGKKRMTIEEREAAYNEARSRIFMGFKEKEKEKEKDLSSSSSSLSLVSGSASTSGGGESSSTGDLDDSVSSPATESEWSGPSGPITRDKKDGRFGNAPVASSSRSLRSSAPPFNANGSGSSRNSRAPSPAFTYASLYEPPASVLSYDTAQHPGQVPGPGYMASPYLYPYPPPGQPSNPPFLAPYQFFAPYNPYPPPLQHPQQTNSDNSTPSGGEMYSPSQQIGYGNPYVWPHPNQPPLPPQMQQHPQPPSQPLQNLNHVNHPPAQNAPQYPPYMPPASYQPPMPGYYPPQPVQHMASPPPHMNAQPMYEIPRSMNGNNGPGIGNTGNGGRNGFGNGNGIGSVNHGQASSRNSAPPGGVNGAGKQRGVPPPRAPWSFGPGVGMGGHSYNGAVSAAGMGGGEVVGPRLSSMRRPSGNSVGSSGTNRSSSNCDESSSTASSSTTSSSSRRTYTSTSSQHPLPPRPDWAVGLKPQPMLHSNHNRHHENSSTNPRNMSPISPPRNLNGGSPNSNVSLRQQQAQQMPPVLLQATDFPPLTSLSSTQEKRAPVVAGAWTNSSSTRSILMPSPGHANTPGNALVYHPSTHAGANNNNARFEEPDRGFERPPPKGTTELFNPKVVRRPTSNNGNNRTNSLPQDKLEKERARGDAVANAILVGQVSLMSLEDHQGVDGSSTAAPAAKETFALAMST